MGVEYKQLMALGHRQKGHSSVCSGATCKLHLPQGLGAKGGGALSSWHSDLGRGPRRSPQQRCLSGCAVLHWVGRSSEQAAGSSSPLAAAPSPASSLTGIIDLSQVPHLPVLVPPTPGTPATAMDRLAYLPTAPQHFSSRLSSSPLSPGDAPTPVLGVLGQMPCPLCPILEDESGWWGGFLSLGLSRRPLGFQEARLT